MSRRAKRRAAAVKYPRLPDAEVGVPADWDRLADGFDTDASRFEEPGQCDVVLTWRAFEAFDAAEWNRTLRHELVHVEQVQRFGTTGHGAAFRRRCDDVDATRHCPSFHRGRYLVRCRGCGDVVADRCRRCRTTRTAAQSVADQRGSVAPSPCCGAYYRLEDTRAD
ncbi:transcription elongation protein SprT [Halobaculum sp. D14]|uniref:transcription elongation protein SprT n=1 Tax=unclassified Halobaculum TaxID=2640896 RepID=UPI003EBBC65B